MYIVFAHIFLLMHHPNRSGTTHNSKGRDHLKRTPLLLRKVTCHALVIESFCYRPLYVSENPPSRGVMLYYAWAIFLIYV